MRRMLEIRLCTDSRHAVRNAAHRRRRRDSSAHARPRGAPSVAFAVLPSCSESWVAPSRSASVPVVIVSSTRRVDTPEINIAASCVGHRSRRAISGTRRPQTSACRRSKMLRLRPPPPPSPMLSRHPSANQPRVVRTRRMTVAHGTRRSDRRTARPRRVAALRSVTGSASRGERADRAPKKKRKKAQGCHVEPGVGAAMGPKRTRSVEASSPREWEPDRAQGKLKGQMPRVHAR